MNLAGKGRLRLNKEPDKLVDVPGGFLLDVEFDSPPSPPATLKASDSIVGGFLIIYKK